MWYNCIEEIVFRDEDFNSDFPCDPRGGLAALQRKVQALQAAYMVCLYQNWEGTDASKSRVRRSRFATLISVSQLSFLVIGVVIDRYKYRQLEMLALQQEYTEIIAHKQDMSSNGITSPPEKRLFGKYNHQVTDRDYC